MTDPYENLNATARRREQEEDLGFEEYDRLYQEISERDMADWNIEGDFDGSQYQANHAAIHAEVVARMKAAKDAAQD